MRNNHASDYVAEFVNLLFIISGWISAQFCNKEIWRIGGICMSCDMEEIRRHYLCMKLTLIAKNLEFLIFEYKFILGPVHMGRSYPG
jgi:hypothetical protein